MAYMGFAALKNRIGKEKGVSNPGAVAASIGRNKYGASKFNAAAAAGKSLKGATPLKKAFGR